jgi:4-amino-4-deoxy-L-arabinose transferase-like glycosyltransferase
MNKPLNPVRLSDVVWMVTLALAGAIAAAAMSLLVLERIPHLEDEITYLFQARTYARGVLWGPAPPIAKVFGIPFTLVFGDKWVGKYPTGWPLLLAIGEHFDAGWLVNPVLGGLTIVVIYLICVQLFDRQHAITASLLTGTSPLFLIQSGTYMSHAAGAFWASLCMLAALHLAGEADRPGWSLLGGVSLGMLALTRQLTAGIIGVSLALWLIVIWRKGKLPLDSILWRSLPLLLTALLVASFQPYYLWRLTGSPFTNLYILYWPYDRIGFGPGFGPYEGHTLCQGLITAAQDLTLWSSDFLGLWYASWLLPLAGVIGLIRIRCWTYLLPFLLPFILLVVVHVGYWVGAQIYGPRYYYEALTGMMILSTYGLRIIVDVLRKQFDSWRLAAYLDSIVLLLLVLLNITTYLPGRISYWRGLYEIHRLPLSTLENLAEDRPVLVLVRGNHWVEYAPLFAGNSPWLDEQIVAAHDFSPERTGEVIALYGDRTIWYYRDGIFSRAPFSYMQDDP